MGLQCGYLKLLKYFLVGQCPSGQDLATIPDGNLWWA
jgi:hypothetical protein